ncbi:MAG: hypothetical protein ACSHX0_09910 [Akkermansiaceae bacterium]
MNIKLVLVMLCFGVVFLFGCKRDEKVVKYIFPDNFTGVFYVTEDNEIENIQNSDGGSIIIHVPDNGIVSLKNTDFLYSRHKTMAEFENGQKISCHAEYPDRAYSLFFLVSRPDKGVYYFLGSEDIYNKVIKSFDVSKLPLAQKL